jgi:hypothetical protein
VKLAWVFRRYGGVLRLARLTWDTGTVGDGDGYSSLVSLGLAPRVFVWKREYQSWFLVLAGVRLHWSRSYGGIFS